MKFPATPRFAKAAMVLVIALVATLIAGPLYAGQQSGVLPLSAPESVLRVSLGGERSKPQLFSSIRTQNKSISRDQAAALVKRRYGGKILAISEVQRNGRSMYRVKGLSDKSQVYVVFVDKQSGQISR
ncbi:PepSY domain-containing protein [Microbulbifer sp. CAU 1566]|uniref:PepSY domain-containing protein n=1 Tax=Microbulbifer sp. CAU 1566 TaxID=2933269 RepID=UPI002006C02B|nr:PepSY domain-containing protein [Microbulbifer sp. CAU 1566]